MLANGREQTASVDALVVFHIERLVLLEDVHRELSQSNGEIAHAPVKVQVFVKGGEGQPRGDGVEQTASVSRNLSDEEVRVILTFDLVGGLQEERAGGVGRGGHGDAQGEQTAEQHFQDMAHAIQADHLSITNTLFPTKQYRKDNPKS